VNWRQEHPNYYALGAIGPDLFFLLPDFRSETGTPIGNTPVGVADFVDDLIQWIDDWIQVSVPPASLTSLTSQPL
jgi:hypothetical protein